MARLQMLRRELQVGPVEEHSTELRFKFLPKTLFSAQVENVRASTCTGRHHYSEFA
jgi:hypothetical protein